MEKASSSPEPAKAAVTESVPVAAAKADRVVRVEGIVERIESLPAPDSLNVLEDERANLAAFLSEGYDEKALKAKIKNLLG